MRRLAEVKADYLKRSPEARKHWEGTSERRALGMMLAEARTRMGLSQSELAQMTGWDKGYVSRLEGATDGFPNLRTLTRYLAACGEGLGLVTYSTQYGGQNLDFKSFLPIGREEGAQASNAPEAAVTMPVPAPRFFSND